MKPKTAILILAKQLKFGVAKFSGAHKVHKALAEGKVDGMQN